MKLILPDVSEFSGFSAFFHKKGLVVLGLLLLGQILNAQVIYSDIRPNKEIIEEQKIPFDINNDGVTDCELYYNYYTGYQDRYFLFQIYTHHNTAVAVQNDSVVAFDENELIEPNMEWNDTTVLNIQLIDIEYLPKGSWSNVHTGYLGLRLQIDNQYYYAWLRLYFVDNSQLFAIDCAYNSIPNEPIVAGDGIPKGATSVVLTDVGNYFSGRDFKVLFNSAINQAEISEYRIIISKAQDTSVYNLQVMNQVPAERFITAAPADSSFLNSETLFNLYLDKDGDSIERFVPYRACILNVSSSGITTENTISEPSDSIILQAFVNTTHRPIATLTDTTNTAADIRLTIEPYLNDFTKEFRALVMPIEDTAVLSVTDALLLPSANSVRIPYSDTTQVTQINMNQLDINGNQIVPNHVYFIKILSVPDSISAIQGKFSKVSNRIVLGKEGMAIVGDTSSFNMNVFECDFAFSEFNYWTGSNLVQSSGMQDVDLNRDGIDDFYFYGSNWGSNIGSSFILSLIPYRNNKVLLCDHAEHSNWIDELDYGVLYGDLYRWSNDESFLKYLHSATNIDNNVNIGHYTGPYARVYYVAFRLEDSELPQYAWLKIQGTRFLQYGFQDIRDDVNAVDASGFVRLFPNPASDYITIEQPMKYSKNLQINILNSLGQTIQQLESGSPQTTISVKGFPSGIYLVTIRDNGKIVETKKLVIE